MIRLSLLLLVGLLVCAAPQNILLLSDKFQATSNSTCDPANCSSSSQHINPNAVFDGLPTTWWESKENETPVLLSLSSDVSLTGFSLSVNIRFQGNSLPYSISLTSGENKNLQAFYSVNCSSFDSVVCHELTFVQQVDNTSEVLLTNFTLHSDNGFNIVFSGFQEALLQRYVVQEITVNGIIEPGYYLPSLQRTLTEVENGIIINSTGYINVGFNKTTFPNFSGQGYAVLMSNQALQMMLVVNHTTSFDNLFLHYVNTGSQNITVSAILVQDQIFCDVQFLCEICFENCVSKAQSNCTSNSLRPGPVTVIIQANGNNLQLLLDYVLAVPDAFQSTIDMCTDIINLNENCTRMALQQSLDLYLSLQECQCSLDYSNDSACETYGGQCQCIERGEQIGRQCTACLHSSYLNDTLGVCLSCECLNNAPCSTDGQCFYLGIPIPPPPVPFPPPVNCSINTTGDFCELCADGYYNSSLNEELECKLCPCNEPNSNKSCQVVNGEPICFCNIGFTGSLCGSCSQGFFGSVCQNCDCSVGAVNISCDATGQCYCTNNVEGNKCQNCLKYHHSISSGGCLQCDSCVYFLRQYVLTLVAELTTVDTSAMRAGYFQSNDTLELVELQSIVIMLRNKCNITLVNITKGLMNFTGIPNEINDVEINLFDLRNLVNALLNNATRALPNSELIFNEVRDFHNRLGGTVSVDYTMTFVNSLETKMKQLASNSNETVTSLSSFISDLSQQSLTNNTNTTKLYIDFINGIENQIKFLRNQTRSELAIIRLETYNLDKLIVVLNELQARIYQLFVTIGSINISLLENQYDELANMSNNISSSISQSKDLIGRSDSNFDFVAESLSKTNSDINHLENLLNNMGMFTGSGSGKLVSQQNIYEQIMTLNITVNQLMQQFQMNAAFYQNAVQNANSTTTQRQFVCNAINSSIHAGGNMAVDAIMNYTFVNDTLSLANDLILLTNATLINVQHEIDLLMSDQLDANVTKAIDTISSLIINVQHLNNNITDLKTWYDFLFERLIMVVNDLNLLNEAMNLLANKYYNVQTTTTIATQLISSRLLETLQNISTANLTLWNMMGSHSSYLTNVRKLTMELNELTVNNTKTNSYARVANGTGQDAEESFLERVEYLDMIENEYTQLMAEISSSKEAIIDIQQQLIEAQEAAALVDIALRFHGNGTSSYNLSHSPQEGTHISLYFQPDSYSGVLLTDAMNNTLQLENGHLKWSSGDQELTATGLNIYLDEWYQVEASNDKSFFFLSVAPLQEPGDSTVTVTVQANSNVFPVNSFIVLAGDNDSFYSGCMDRVIVNGERIPLLLPNATDVNIMACGPRPAVEASRALETSAWFQGQSHLSLTPTYFTEGVISFSFHFRTFSQTSQLAMLQSSNMMQFVSVYINNSVINLQVSSEGDNQNLSSTVIINDGSGHYVTVSIEDFQAALIVDQMTVTKNLSGLDVNLSSPVNITLGGVSGSNIPSFSGCLSNFSVEDTLIDFSQLEQVERVELSGCPSSVSPGTRFMGSGLAIFSMNNFVTSVSFSFRTVHLSSVLLTLSNKMLPDRLIVTLFHTYLRVEMVNTFNNIVITSSKFNLNNGFWHDVSISLVSNRLLLSVDGVANTEIVANNTNFLLISGDVTIGGLPDDWLVQEIVTDYYRGCFNDLIINGDYYDFNNAVLSSGVALFGCHEEMTMGSGSGDYSIIPSISSTEPVPSSTEDIMSFSTEDMMLSSTEEIMPSSTKDTMPSSTEEVMPSSTEYMMPSSTEDMILSSTLLSPTGGILSSTQFSTLIVTSSSMPIISPTPTPAPIITPVGLNGEQGSFLAYNTSDLTHYFSITLTFRTGSSNALLLYSQHPSLVDYMALELRNGQLHYSYDLGAGSVFITTPPIYRYDDNMNHTVAIVRNSTRGMLIIDGQMEYNDSSIGSFTQLNLGVNNTLFVGGVSFLSRYSIYSDQSQVPPGALACFYSLEVNNELIDLNKPMAANGMVSCQGTYSDYVSFNGSGYAKLVDEYKPLVSYGFRLDFRTLYCTGLMLYSSSLYLEDHTAIEINQGKIRFIFDNGKGAGIVEYIPANLSSLCDGNWHQIQATKNGGTGSLVVDGQPRISNTTEFLSVDTFSPLFAGGVPDDILVRYTVTSESFQGCMNNVQLIDSNLDSRNVTTNVNFSESPGVELNTCQL